MRTGLAVAVLIGALSCVTGRRLATTPAFTEGTWRIRLDVDSTPGRRPPNESVVYGTINFARAHYAIDLFRALSHSGIANTALIVAPVNTDAQQPPVYRIILGDSASFDDKLVLLAHPVTVDSLIGTWSETIVCCSAAGRFTLWRAQSGGSLEAR